MTTSKALIATSLCLMAAFTFTSTANAKHEDFINDPYVGIGYGSYLKSDFKEEGTIANLPELLATNGQTAIPAGDLSGSGKAETTNEFHVLYGGYIKNIPLKVEIEGSYARIKQSGSGNVLDDSGNSLSAVGFKNTTAITTIGVNGIFQTEIAEGFKAGIGAGIGFSNINPDDLTITSQTNGDDFIGIFSLDSENSARFSSIVELTADITDGTRATFRHNFVRFPGSDLFDDTYSKFSVGLQFDI